MKCECPCHKQRINSYSHCINCQVMNPITSNEEPFKPFKPLNYETCHKFWFVWKCTDDRTPISLPKHKHSTLLSAKLKAERLAKADPGSILYVLESKGYAKVENVIYNELK